MPDKANVFACLPTALAKEVYTVLLDRPGIRIERIVSTGQVSPPGFWFDQLQDEWVMVLQGAAKLRFENEDEAINLGPGDCVEIAAHRRHRVEWTTPNEPTVWLAVFYG